MKEYKSLLYLCQFQISVSKNMYKNSTPALCSYCLPKKRFTNFMTTPPVKKSKTFTS